MEDITTQKYLKSILRYNPVTGVWKWRNALNGRPKRKIAGCKNNLGYIMITHNGKKYQAHRLAFLYMEGYLSENFVDHINRNPTDNRWDNLREVSTQCNAQNKTHAYTNKSGVVGVVLKDEWGGWVAQIKVDKKTKYIGYSTNKNEAVLMRWEAEVKYNYSGCNENSEAYLYLKERNLIP